MVQHAHRFVLSLALLLVLVACAPVTPAPMAPPSTETPRGPAQTGLPPAVEYNLGDATLLQAQFPEDSRFRQMPVRLNGVIAVPPGAGGPYPVVVILHGTHPGCPVPDGDMVDRWPCAPEVEPPNYRGVTVAARVRPRRGVAADLLRDDAVAALYRFLHPRTGGPDGAGWPFGRPVTVGDVHAALADVAGLDYVEDARLFPADPTTGARGEQSTRVEVGPEQLPFSYNHQVAVVTA